MSRPKPFVVLLRGVNVGGRNVVRMEPLREALTAAGFGAVATHVQSGNIVLVSAMAADELAATVARAFAGAFGFESRPTVRDLPQWRRVVEGNPFRSEAEDHRSVSAVFLGGEPSTEAVSALAALAVRERIALAQGVLYLHSPDGFGRSKLASSLDRVLGVPLTARNWRTVTALLEMAQKADSYSRSHLS